MSDRASFPIYKIERDNFDGRLITRLSFAPLGAPCRHLTDGHGRVYADDLDGGPAGTITAPAGSTLAETGDGETVLVLPGGSTLGADDAYRAARESVRARSFGLGWSPHRPSEGEASPGGMPGRWTKIGCVPYASMGPTAAGPGSTRVFYSRGGGAEFCYRSASWGSHGTGSHNFRDYGDADGCDEWGRPNGKTYPAAEFDD